MSSLDDWVEGRTPVPPIAVRTGLELRSVPADGEPCETLAEEGLRRLALARSRPGRVRESAFELLAADALLTYACEAALETEDPEGRLAELLRRIAGP